MPWPPTIPNTVAVSDTSKILQNDVGNYVKFNQIIKYSYGVDYTTKP